MKSIIFIFILWLSWDKVFPHQNLNILYLNILLLWKRIIKIFLAFESLTSSNDALYNNNLILVSHTSFPKQLVQHLFFKSDNSTFQAFMHNINARNIYFSRKIISKMSSHYVIRMIISLTSYISTCLEISKALEFQIVAD